MLFSRCIEAARACFASGLYHDFLVAVRLAQSQAQDDAEVNRLLDEALAQFPAPCSLELVDAAAALRWPN